MYSYKKCIRQTIVALNISVPQTTVFLKHMYSPNNCTLQATVLLKNFAHQRTMPFQTTVLIKLMYSSNNCTHQTVIFLTLLYCSKYYTPQWRQIYIWTSMGCSPGALTLEEPQCPSSLGAPDKTITNI